MTVADDRVLLVAPDKMRGTLGALAVADALAAGAGHRWQVDRCPLSDGGEGFACVVAPRDSHLVSSPVTGPLGGRLDASWYRHGATAFLEAASASGLARAGGAPGNDPLGATTTGTGELIVAALAAGCRRIVLGVGGTATTDGGIGAVEAIRGAGGLGDVELVVACDVRTRFTDAAAEFAPQKGADVQQVERLTKRLERLARRYLDDYGVDVTALDGSGAGGGLCGGLAVLGARLVGGFDLVADAVGLEARLGRAAMVVSAEGQLDASSWSGKVVGELARTARRLAVPMVVVAGQVRDAPPGIHSDVTVVDLNSLFGTRASLETAACLTSVSRQLFGDDSARGR
ncbi:MAG: glycerate kinase [Acidimicrobiales bacterium]